MAKLSKASRSDNLMLAFSVAERAGVPRLLSIDDMADKRNIFTWITHLYHSLTPALQGTLLVQRGSAKGSSVWRKESIRLIQNRFSLSLCSVRSSSTEDSAAVAASSMGVDDNSLLLPDDLQWFNLAMARIAQLPITELHKEVRTAELDKRAVPVLAIYLGPALLLLTSDTAHDIDAWFSFLTQQIIGSVIVGAPPSSILQLATYDGWLLKKGDRGPNKSWKRRYFVLRDNRLRYGKKPFTWITDATSGTASPTATVTAPSSASSSPSSSSSSVSEKVAKMTYSLRLSTGINPLPALHPFCFSVDLPCRSLILRGETRVAMESWVDVLRRSRESYLRTTHQLVPTREKEGIVRIESLVIASGFYYAAARQGILFLSDKEKPNVQKAKVPLYESEAEVCDLAGVTQQSVRLLVGGREARNSRVYYVSGASQEDTLDWFEVIVRQRQLMASYVNSCRWPAPPATDDEGDDEEADGAGNGSEQQQDGIQPVATSPPPSSPASPN